MMREAMDLLASPWTFVLVLIVFSLAPNVLIRVVAAFYPKGHARRSELIAELYAVPHRERPLWVLDQLWLGVGEGLRARRREAAFWTALRTSATFYVTHPEWRIDRSRFLATVEELSPLVWSVARSSGDFCEQEALEVLEGTWLRVLRTRRAPADAAALAPWLVALTQQEIRSRAACEGL
jgi:hypothetical protein